MIISKEAIKDTYVTNRVIGNSLTESSNVGRASTLDLFKLCNENNNAFSSGKIKLDINNNNTFPTENSGFTLKDTSGNVCNFIFVNAAVENVGEHFQKEENSGSFLIGTTYEIVSLNNGAGGENTDFTLIGSLNNVIGTKFVATGSGEGTGIANTDFIKLSNVGTKSVISSHISSVINNVTEYTQTGNVLGNQRIDITAYSNSQGEVILKQDVKGTAGDTLIALFGTHNLNKVDFKRIESSSLLIKFDLEKFKSDFITADIANSLFNIKSNLEAKVVLKDVSTGHTKPFDYNIEISPLKKSFKEGLGKDTIHFSDIDKSNFISLDASNNWQIPGYVSKEDDVYVESKYTDTFNVKKGDENIEFDVTEWLYDFITEVNASDFGFLVSLPSSELEDNNSYFVKRIGSRHLLNKKLVPTLQIKIKDDSINKIPKPDKQRYLDTAETFFLLNEKEGLLSDFTVPNGYTQKLCIDYQKNDKVSSKGSITVEDNPEDTSTFILSDANGNTVTFEFSTGNNISSGEIKGETSNIEIGISDLIEDPAVTSPIASRIASVINNVTEYEQKDPNDATKFVNQKLNITAVADQSKVILRQDTSGSLGDTVIITSENPEGTNFNPIENFKRFETIEPALENFVNLKGSTVLGIKKSSITNSDISQYNEFLNKEIKENGYATFDLTWKYYQAGEHIDSFEIKKESVKFYLPDISASNYLNTGDLRVVSKVRNNDIIANDSIFDIDVFFHDINKQYKVSKMPYDLPCSNLGNLYYNVTDEDTGEKIISGDINFTKLFWNGKNYEFSFYSPVLLKNRRIKFEYISENNVYSNSFTFKNNKEVFKVT
jgi:hypothetical protein